MADSNKPPGSPDPLVGALRSLINEECALIGIEVADGADYHVLTRLNEVRAVLDEITTVMATRPPS